MVHGGSHVMQDHHRLSILGVLGLDGFCALTFWRLCRYVKKGWLSDVDFKSYYDPEDEHLAGCHAFDFDRGARRKTQLEAKGSVQCPVHRLSTHSG